MELAAASLWRGAHGAVSRRRSGLLSLRRLSVSAHHITDKCDHHVVASPYDKIAPGPYPPLYEFLTANWSQTEKMTAESTIHENSVAIVDTHTGLQRTFGDHFRTMGSLAAALQSEMQVGFGDCVALYCPNHVDYLTIPLAVSLTGAMLTPINPLYSTHELVTVLQRSRSKVLLTHQSKLDTALQAAKEANIAHVIVISDDGGTAKLPAGSVAFDSLILQYQNQPVQQTVTEIHNQSHLHACILPYSSGTTGLPKGVCLTHENIVANLLQIEAVERFEPQHKLISPLPFFHIYAFTISLLYTAWKGHTLLTSSGRFDLEAFCRAVQDHKVERAHLVPPILLGLAKSPLVDQYDLSSLQTIVSAAAPLGSDIEQAIAQRLGNGCVVKQYWGMSELSPLATACSDFNAKSGSVGPLTGSTHGKIVDEHGNSLGPNQSGELLIQGPQVMKEYLNEPEKTAETLSASGWLRTGDVAHYDDDGHFYITDRIKELIKVRGYQVAPAELEALLLTHPAIRDVAVIGKPDKASGEVPLAHVVLKDDHQTTSADDIYAWVKERVAPYKRLDGGIAFCESVPKSASGKLLRRILRDELAKKAEGGE